MLSYMLDMAYPIRAKRNLIVSIATNTAGMHIRCFAIEIFKALQLYKTIYLFCNRILVECPVCESNGLLPTHEHCNIIRGNKKYKKCEFGTYKNEVCGNRRDCYRV